MPVEIRVSTYAHKNVHAYNIYTYIHTHTHTRTYAHALVCTYTDTCIKTHMCIQICIYIYICLYLYIHTYIHVRREHVLPRLGADSKTSPLSRLKPVLATASFWRRLPTASLNAGSSRRSTGLSSGRYRYVCTLSALAFKCSRHLNSFTVENLCAAYEPSEICSLSCDVTRTCMHTYIHAYIPTSKLHYIHTCIRTLYKYVHAYTNAAITYSHSCMFAYMHTYIHASYAYCSSFSILHS